MAAQRSVSLRVVVECTDTSCCTVCHASNLSQLCQWPPGCAQQCLKHSRGMCAGGQTPATYTVCWADPCPMSYLRADAGNHTALHLSQPDLHRTCWRHGLVKRNLQQQQQQQQFVCLVQLSCNMSLSHARSRQITAPKSASCQLQAAGMTCLQGRYRSRLLPSPSPLSSWL